jgi:hypothetical protein
VTFDLHRPLPVEGVWAAIDADSGDYAVGSPRGAVVETLAPARGWFWKHGGATSSPAMESGCGGGAPGRRVS